MSNKSGIFGGSLTADALNIDFDGIPSSDTLVIRMTRGERKAADELHRAFGDFKRFAIDVDGERHEFSADGLIRLLEGYEGASRYAELFGTPERAARTLFDICDECEDSTCRGCKIYPLVDHACDYDALLEWFRGNAE